MYMKRTPTLANKGSRKNTTQTDAENMENSGDETDRATIRSTAHTPQLFLHADQR